MAKLNQVIAAEPSVRSRAQAQITKAHHDLQRSGLVNGMNRTYRSKTEDGETFPPEIVRVQVRAEDAIAQVATSLTELFDITVTRDAANQAAAADVVVDGGLLAADVPVSTLLFLEKQLTDLNTFVRKLPVLDPAESWRQDANDLLRKTGVVTTHKTRKVPRNHVKAEATDRHPAQVEIFHEDVTIGYWDTVKVSGALPATTIDRFADRVAKLLQAVKFARETANGIEAPNRKIGESLMSWVFDSAS